MSADIGASPRYHEDMPRHDRCKGRHILGMLATMHFTRYLRVYIRDAMTITAYVSQLPQGVYFKAHGKDMSGMGNDSIRARRQTRYRHRP